jgi:hypothetical protein
MITINLKRFIYQLIYNIDMTQKNIFARSPTLETVLMVENFIKKYSGEYTKRKLWQNLPKKVMWQTYLVTIDYLQDINKIAIDKEGKIGYIWNPELAKKLKLRKEIKL